MSDWQFQLEGKELIDCLKTNQQYEAFPSSLKGAAHIFNDKNCSLLCFQCDLANQSHLQSAELLLAEIEACLCDSVLDVETGETQVRPYPAAWSGSVWNVMIRP